MIVNCVKCGKATNVPAVLIKEKNYFRPITFCCCEETQTPDAKDYAVYLKPFTIGIWSSQRKNGFDDILTCDSLEDLRLTLTALTYNYQGSQLRVFFCDDNKKLIGFYDFELTAYEDIPDIMNEIESEHRICLPQSDDVIVFGDYVFTMHNNIFNDKKSVWISKRGYMIAYYCYTIDNHSPFNREYLKGVAKSYMALFDVHEEDD